MSLVGEEIDLSQYKQYKKLQEFLETQNDVYFQKEIDLQCNAKLLNTEDIILPEIFK